MTQSSSHRLKPDGRTIAALLEHAHARVEQTRHGLRCADCSAPLPPEEVLGQR